MNQAFDTSYFTKLGLLSLLNQFHRFQLRFYPPKEGNGVAIPP